MGNSKKGESEKNECPGERKEFIRLDISLGWLIVKRDFVKKNMALGPVSNVDIGLF